MRVLLQGYRKVNSEWHIIEPQRTGYSRVYFITSGGATYTDSWITKQLQVGKLYLLPSEIPFELTHNPKDPLCCLYYHFDFFPLMVDRPIELDVPCSLKHILHSLICQFTENATHTRFYYETVRLLHDYIIDNTELKHVNSKVSTCLELIRKQYKNHDISIEQISNVAGYTPEHFNRLFKQYLNTTPYQYVIQLRMQEAVRLLLAGVSVSEVTESVGFADTKSFSRAFKKHFGVAPSKYNEYYQDIP